MEETSPIGQECPQCHQGTIGEKKGVSKKTNKPFHFYGCSNYPACNFIWRAETKSEPQRKAEATGTAIMYDDIMARFSKLDETHKAFQETLVKVVEVVNRLLKK